MDKHIFTLGIEEEFMLGDPETRGLVSHMQQIVETARREQLGQQMVCDLLDIAQLTSQPIKQMVLNEKEVFEEEEG